MVQYSALQYSTAQYSTVQFSSRGVSNKLETFSSVAEIFSRNLDVLKSEIFALKIIAGFLRKFSYTKLNEKMPENVVNFRILNSF